MKYYDNNISDIYKELKSTESYLISAMWQNPDLFAEIQINNKSNSPYKIYNNDWKILYDTGKYLALDCKMKNLMDFSKVPTLLKQNPELEKQFNSLGDDPFTYIQNCISSVNAENINYGDCINKYGSLKHTKSGSNYYRKEGKMTEEEIKVKCGLKEHHCEHCM